MYIPNVSNVRRVKRKWCLIWAIIFAPRSKNIQQNSQKVNILFSKDQALKCSD